jgi:Carbohydrate binding domain
MKLSLKNPASRILLLALSSLLATAFLTLAGSQYLAAVFSNRADAASLRHAIWLQPGNAEYRHRLGLYLSLLQPEEAARSYEAAVALNPYRAGYWISLAQAYETLGNPPKQAAALRNAYRMSPTDPSIVWETANAFFSRGDLRETRNECRTLLQDDGPMFDNALPFCWRVQPDADAFLGDLLPRNPVAYASLLDLLITKRDNSASAKIWQGLVNMGSPIPRQQVFDYVHYLIGQQQSDAAAQVWRQAGPLAALSEYQPSGSNLIVNGDFSMPVLNGGFDWLYEKSSGVSLTLDPEQHSVGRRSLLIAFEGAQVEDAGIRELVPVRPNTAYTFSANFRTRDLEGAGGVRFAIEDAVHGTPLYASDDLNSPGSWQRVTGSFLTGASTRLLTVRLQRLPAGDIIQGKLWIDDVRLTEKKP